MPRPDHEPEHAENQRTEAEVDDERLGSGEEEETEGEVEGSRREAEGLRRVEVEGPRPDDRRGREQGAGPERDRVIGVAESCRIQEHLRSEEAARVPVPNL